MPDDDELPDDHDWIGPALAPIPDGHAPFGRAAAPLWTEDKKKKKEPPVVAYMTERQGGNYYHFKNGVVLVKHSNISGGWTCLFSHCIGAKKANDCLHVSIAQTYAATHRLESEERVGSDPDANPFPNG